MWWEGQHRLSHWTNLSAKVAVLFSTAVGGNILHTEEVVRGRPILVKTEIKVAVFYFINV